jgi:two-component system CheB/CheR fusion protein
MRILPYRTTENVIDGMVVTFVDISKVKSLQEETNRLVSALGSSPTGIFGQSAQLSYEWACGNIVGQRAEQLIGRTDQEVFGDGAAGLVELKREVLAKGTPLRRRLKLGPPGNQREHEVYVQPVTGKRGQLTGITGILTAVEDAVRKNDPS